MKTGKLLKFHRPGAEVHAYLYRDGTEYRGAIYVVSEGGRRSGEPRHTISAPTEAAVELGVRTWVDGHYPRAE